jgi:hypothetical protein
MLQGGYKRGTSWHIPGQKFLCLYLLFDQCSYSLFNTDTRQNSSSDLLRRLSCAKNSRMVVRESEAVDPGMT